MKIPTAEEWVKSISKKAGSFILKTDGSKESEARKKAEDEEMYDWFREFAKLHVKAALEAAADDMMFGYKSNRGAVYYDAYPETNIK